MLGLLLNKIRVKVLEVFGNAGAFGERNSGFACRNSDSRASPGASAGEIRDRFRTFRGKRIFE
jgi:hypothetical protein